MTSIKISCSHDGYAKLKSPVIHKRLWEFLNNSMTISDEIIGNFITGEAFYLFHPNIVVSAVKNYFILILPDRTEVVFRVLNGKARLIDRFWSPEFGRSIQTKCIVIEAKSSKIDISITGYAQ